MQLEKVDVIGLKDTYALSSVWKEFKKAVDEPWVHIPPWKRYQKKLLQDLAVLEEEKERAVDLPQYEKLSGEDRLYSIRHPETKKNIRVTYTIIDSRYIILLTVFLEKNVGDYQRAINVAKKRLKILEE